MLQNCWQSLGLLCTQAYTAQHPGAARKAAHSCCNLHVLTGWAQDPGQPHWCKRWHVVCGQLPGTLQREQQPCYTLSAPIHWEVARTRNEVPVIRETCLLTGDVSLGYS